MYKRHLIIVARQEGLATSIARDAITFITCATLVGIGIVVDSAAMQWLGALIAFLLIITLAVRISEKQTYDIDGAQKELDRIRREVEAEAEAKENGR